MSVHAAKGLLIIPSSVRLSKAELAGAEYRSSVVRRIALSYEGGRRGGFGIPSTPGNRVELNFVNRYRVTAQVRVSTPRQSRDGLEYSILRGHFNFSKKKNTAIP